MYMHPVGLSEHDLSVATDRQRHEDQESSSPRAHCKCNGPGTFCVSVSVSVLILAMIQDQVLVASKRSKHYLVGKKSPGRKKVGGSFKMDDILQIQGPHLGSKGKGSSSHWVPPSNSWTNATSTGWVICIIKDFNSLSLQGLQVPRNVSP